MAVSKQEVILEFNADTTGVAKSIDNVEKSIEGTSKATAGLTTQLDKMTGGAVTGLKNFTAGLKSGVAGLKSFKVALAATGIGLLITAIASLVSYFRDTERGAQRLRVITATLGTVFEKFRDILIAVGERLFEAFSNPQQALRDFGEALRDNIITRFEGLLTFIPSIGKAIKQLFERDFAGAAQTAADAAGKVVFGVDSVTDSLNEGAKAAADYAKETRDAAAAAAELARQENDLKVAEREFLSVRAQTNKTIAENRLLVEDEKLAFEDRIGALDAAIAAEQRTVAQELEFARQRAEILERKAELAKSDEATIQAVAEAQAQVIQLETRSLRTQKRLEGERQSLILQREARAKQEQAEAQKAVDEAEKAAQAELEARQKLEDELFALSLSAKEREELVARQRYDARIAIAGDDEGLIKAATEQLNADLAAIQDKADEQAKLKREQRLAKEDADAEARRQAVLGVAKQTLGALAALNDAFGAASIDRANKIAELEDAIGEAQDEREKNRLINQRNELAKIQDAEGKKQFERGKKIQIAQTLISTYESAVQAFKSLSGIPVVGPGLGVAAAAAATATGLAAVEKIKQQTFEGAGTVENVVADSPSISGTATQATQAPQAPQLDLSFLGEGAVSDAPIQAFVISQDVSNAQQANQQIQEQAQL